LKINDLKDVKEMYCKFNCPNKNMDKEDISIKYCCDCDSMDICLAQDNNCKAYDTLAEFSYCKTCQIDNFIEELYQNKLIEV
jgi:hypothetical protein